MDLTEHSQSHNVPAIILNFPGEPDPGAAMRCEEKALQRSDPAGAAQVDAVSTDVVERRSRGERQLQAAVQLGRPWRFEAVLMAVVWEQEKRIWEMVIQVEETTPGSASDER